MSATTTTTTVKTSRKRPSKAQRHRRALAMAAGQSGTGILRSVLPYTRMAPFMYWDAGVLTMPSLGATTGLEYLVNSLYDPHYTGGGHQPFMLDQFADLYSQYRVHSFEIQYELGVLSYDQSAMTAVLTPRLGGSTASLSSLSIPYAEYPQAQSRIVNSSQKEVLTFKANVWDVLGVTRDRYLADPNYLANLNANPGYSALVSLIYGSLDTAVTPKMAWKLRLCMVAELTGLKPQGYS